MGKRKQREDDDGPAPSSEPASIGQQTSHIANKQKRSAAYAKLKHKKEVRLASTAENSLSKHVHMLAVACRKLSAQKEPSGRQQLLKRNSWVWSPQPERFPRFAFTLPFVRPHLKGPSTHPNCFVQKGAQSITDCAVDMHMGVQLALASLWSKLPVTLLQSADY